MRVLFTSPIMEHPPAGGPQLRIENSIKALSKICDLDIINRDIHASDETNSFFSKYATEYHQLSNPEKKLFFNKLLFFKNKFLNRFFDDRHAQYFIDHVHRRKIEVLWFGYGNISYSLIKRIKKLNPELKIVCDTDSVWSRFILRELPYAKGLRKFKILFSGKKKEFEEKASVKLSDVTTAVSKVDADFYRSIARDKSKIHLFSNVIDVDSYSSTPKPVFNFKSPCIYLAGSFGHYNSPMDTAARWMLEEVFPHILNKYPNMHFYIVGRNSELGFGHLNGSNITVTGKLKSVLPYLCNANVAVVPLKFESGTRFKILEAGACKIPIVSTSLGAEGISVINYEHVLIADQPKDFADSILRLIEDKTFAVNLAKNCHHLVRDKYSIETLRDEGRNIFKYLAFKGNKYSDK